MPYSLQEIHDKEQSMKRSLITDLYSSIDEYIESSIKDLKSHSEFLISTQLKYILNENSNLYKVQQNYPGIDIKLRNYSIVISWESSS